MNKINFTTIKTKAYGASSANSLIEAKEIFRRSPNSNDVFIQIEYCGICHSDIHTARGEWGPTHYPCIPGHEIVGKVLSIGKKVKKFKVGDWVGVGCFVDSCGKCASCKNHEEQYCENGPVFTYNSLERDGVTQTYGGYSTHITVKDQYVLKIKKGLPLEKVAPLLCAGITTYSPLKRFGTKKGKKVGVIGLGGLGHMALKLAKAMGAEVVVYSTSDKKQIDAKIFGAKDFIITNKKGDQAFQKWINKLDLIMDTVSAPHDFTPYLSNLKKGGTLVLVGASPSALQVQPFALIGGRIAIAGSLIGGIKETQEMLDFCAKKKVFSEVEVISAAKINEAYERTIKGDVRYRFVVDTKTL